MEPSMPLLIDTDEALTKGMRSLSRRDPVMRRIIKEGAVPLLRKREPGLSGLLWIVVSQQLSTASANAIWARLEQALHPVSAQGLLDASEETLRAAGLSGPKIRTLRAIARAALDGGLHLDGLGDLPAEEAHAALTIVKGIGPWTAEIYLLFCLGHPDIFPAGDLALQEAARIALDLDARPSAKEVAIIAERWAPWRGVAALVLWAYYRIAKTRADGGLGRDGAPLGG
jgi:DNA-3-methyladenine glycosylase II